MSVYLITPLNTSLKNSEIDFPDIIYYHNREQSDTHDFYYINSQKTIEQLDIFADYLTDNNIHFQIKYINE